MYHLGSILRARYILKSLVAIVLLSSLGLHALQIKHSHVTVSNTHTHVHEHVAGHATHEGEHNSKTIPTIDLDVMMHATDKKLFLLILVAICSGVLFFDRKQLFTQQFLVSRETYKDFEKRNKGLLRVYSYIVTTLRRGILHSKAY